MGVGEQFESFRDEYFIPSETVSSISSRYKRITKRLNLDFWNTDSEIAHSLYVGSYGRDTAAKVVSDLDIYFRLPSSVYEKYNAYQTNGQSALLQAVRTSMQKTYPNTLLKGDGQVVIVRFDDGITFEGHCSLIAGRGSSPLGEYFCAQVWCGAALTRSAFSPGSTWGAP